MSYEKFRLTDDAISTNGVEAAPDKLTGTTQENKKVFDRLIRAVVKDIINDLAEQIGTDVARFDSGEGKISAETAAALELNEGATLNEALVRLKNMAASGGITTAEFVAVSKATAEAYGLEGDVTVDMVLQVIADAITEAATKSYTKAETLSPTTKTALGLGEDAVPDDAFSRLAQSGENLLDNWYFADPIDQRGGYVVPMGMPLYRDPDCTDLALAESLYAVKVDELTSSYAKIAVKNGTVYYTLANNAVRGYVGAGYGIDRWANRNNNAVHEIAEDGIKIYMPTTSTTSFARIQQPIANSEQYAGKTLTFSVLLGESTVECGTLMLIYTVDGASQNQYVNYSKADKLVTFTATLPVGTTDLYAVISGTDGRYGDTAETYSLIVAAKLELGSTQTLAHKEGDTWVLNDAPPNKQMETLKCCMSKADSTDKYANGNNYTSLGMTKIVTGSYVGTGTYGEANPCSLTFDAPPILLAINVDYGNKIGETALIVRPDAYSTYAHIASVLGNTNDKLVGQVEGATIRWFSSSSVNSQMNDKYTYNYLAILQKE